MTFLTVLLQDIKERKVFWFLFPIIAICTGFLMFKEVESNLFINTLFFNVLFVGILIGVVYFYSKFKLRQSITETFGLGDGLLFLSLTFTFSSISFFILFVFSLIFSLVVHLFLKKASKFNTVPLAGYMSLFFILVYIFHWLGFLTNIYNI